MKQITLDWLKQQSTNSAVSPEIQEDLIAYLNQNNGKTIPVPTPTNYLVVRATTVTISATPGKWDRKKQEKLFTHSVDGDFENYNAVGKNDKATEAVTGTPWDLAKDGRYDQIIPDIPANFFQNASQALQVVHDNPALQEEVLKQDHRLHIPFVNEKGDKFVALVFRARGRAESVRVQVFLRPRVERFVRRCLHSSATTLATKLVPLHLNFLNP